MPRFLIEIPHESDQSACIHAIDEIRRTGAHFFSKADWGCMDGEHKAWLIVDVDSKQTARGIVPPSCRHDAKVVQLNAFSEQDVVSMVESLA